MATSISNNAFITVWKTDNVGTSSDTQITLPIVNLGTINFFVEWGDGTSDTITSYNQAEITHTFPEAGTYEVKIYGALTAFSFNNGGDKLKILEIKQWGSGFKVTISQCFYNCTNLNITTIDRLVLSGNSFRLFRGASSLPSSIRNMRRWDVSNVTSLFDMFFGCTNFNSNINAWNTSKVTNMTYTFTNCTNFNQPLNNWDVSKVTNMLLLFEGCTNFNQPLNNWNTSKVTNMSRVFRNCVNFNQPLASWDTSLVNNMDGIFFSCTKFNQPLNNWNISNVTNIRSMFQNCTNFNQPLNNWNTSKVTIMQFTFVNCTNFNQPLNDWDVSNVTDMFLLFESCTNFNQPLNNWNTSKVTNMSRVFRLCPSFDQSLASWDVTSVTNMSLMLANSTLSTENYDATLISWANQAVKSNVSFHGGSSKYTAGGAAEAARNTLINTYNWTITDGGSV